MGAWIEIPIALYCGSLSPVAPHMGAWIEIDGTKIVAIWNASHPTWVRGLKYQTFPMTDWKQLSHPTWVRGLKYTI